MKIGNAMICHKSPVMANLRRATLPYLLDKIMGSISELKVSH